MSVNPQEIAKLNAEIDKINKTNDELRTELRAMSMNLQSLIDSYNTKYAEKVTVDNIDEVYASVMKQVEAQYAEAQKIVESINSGTYKKVPMSNVIAQVEKEMVSEKAVVASADVPDSETAPVVEESEDLGATSGIVETGHIDTQEDDGLFVADEWEQTEEDEEESENLDAEQEPVIEKKVLQVAETEDTQEEKADVGVNQEVQKAFWNGFPKTMGLV